MESNKGETGSEKEKNQMKPIARQPEKIPPWRGNVYQKYSSEDDRTQLPR